MFRRMPEIVAALAALLCATASSASEFVPYELVARDGAKVQVERGEITVPENRAHPQGRQIKLGFVRFPALHPTTAPPIAYLAGGPGLRRGCSTPAGAVRDIPGTSRGRRRYRF